MSRTLIEFSAVSKRFCRQPELRGRLAAIDIARELCGLPPGDTLRNGEFWALRDVDLQVAAGEVLGVIGLNGAGKSTLMGLAAGTLLPTTGTITRHARDVCKIDPFSLMSPLETGRENIILQLVYHGIPAAEIDDEVAAIAAFADLTDRLDETVGTYSTGMRGRLGFAIFSRLRPDVFLVDEATGAGDQRFREQFRAYLERYVADGGAMLLCVHDAQMIQTLCERVLLLDNGRVVVAADPAAAIEAYDALAAERGALPMPGFRARGGDPAHAAAATPPAAVDGSAATVPSPALAIVDVHVAGTDGQDPLPGAAAEIGILCTSPAAVDGVTCVVEIGRGGWATLAVIEGPTTTIGPADTALRCRVSSLPLAPGAYHAHVRLLDARSGKVLADTGSLMPARFHVRSPAAGRRAGSGRAPLVHVEASWDTDPPRGDRAIGRPTPG